MDSTILKVKFNNFCKLFPIPENFNKFIETISQKFNVKNFDINDYRITYNDKEGDLILIETNYDYDILKSYKDNQIKINVTKIENQKEEEIKIENEDLKKNNDNNNKNSNNKEEENNDDNWRGKNFNKNFWDKKWEFYNKNYKYYDNNNNNNNNNNNIDNSSSSSSNEQMEFKKFPQNFVKFPFPSHYFFPPPPFFHRFRGRGKKGFCYNCVPQRNNIQNEKISSNNKKNPNEILENINYHIKKENKDLSMLITNQNLFFKFLEKSAEKMEIKLYLFNNGNQPWPDDVCLINEEKFSALKGEKIKIEKKIGVNELCEINVILNTKDVKKGKYLTVWNLMTGNGEKIGETIFMKVKVCVKKERKDKKFNNKNEVNNNENNNNNININNDEDNKEINNSEINTTSNFNKENNFIIKPEDIKFDNNINNNINNNNNSDDM
jgi:hypothetical protein